MKNDLSLISDINKNLLTENEVARSNVDAGSNTNITTPSNEELKKTLNIARDKLDVLNRENKKFKSIESELKTKLEENEMELLNLRNSQKSHKDIKEQDVLIESLRGQVQKLLTELEEERTKAITADEACLTQITERDQEIDDLRKTIEEIDSSTQTDQGCCSMLVSENDVLQKKSEKLESLRRREQSEVKNLEIENRQLKEDLSKLQEQFKEMEKCVDEIEEEKAKSQDLIDNLEDLGATIENLHKSTTSLANNQSDAGFPNEKFSVAVTKLTSELESSAEMNVQLQEQITKLTCDMDQQKNLLNKYNEALTKIKQLEGGVDKLGDCNDEHERMLKKNQDLEDQLKEFNANIENRVEQKMNCMKSCHKEQIQSLQCLHKLEVDHLRREHELEIKGLKTKNSKLRECISATIICNCNQMNTTSKPLSSRRRSPKQQKANKSDIPEERPIGYDEHLVSLCQKIIDKGFHTLTFDELTYIHDKVYKAALKIQMEHGLITSDDSQSKPFYDRERKIDRMQMELKKLIIMSSNLKNLSAMEQKSNGLLSTRSCYQQRKSSPYEPIQPCMNRNRRINDCSTNSKREKSTKKSQFILCQQMW